MESPVDTVQARIVWGSHVSTIKWGLLTHAQYVSCRSSNATD